MVQDLPPRHSAGFGTWCQSVSRDESKLVCATFNLFCPPARPPAPSVSPNWVDAVFFLPLFQFAIVCAVRDSSWQITVTWSHFDSSLAGANAWLRFYQEHSHKKYGAYKNAVMCMEIRIVNRDWLMYKQIRFFLKKHSKENPFMANETSY